MARLSPPWMTANRALASKLARLRRLKAKGLAPLPKSKAAQRELAAHAAANHNFVKSQNRDQPAVASALSANPQD